MMVHQNGSRVKIDHILNVLESVTERGENRWLAKCPCHDDQVPSLSITQKNGKTLVKCFAGCDQQAVWKRITELAGIKRYQVTRNGNNGRNGDTPQEAAETASEPDATTTNENKQPQTQEPAGLTLSELAEKKALPVEFLKKLGVSQVKRGGDAYVKIPYFDADSVEVSVRYRFCMDGDTRFKWARGSKTLLYGLDRLEAAREAGYVVVVEGESDSWTLWFCGVPAVGVPGKSTWKSEWAQHLEGLRVYIWQEPDAEDFSARIGKDIQNAYVIRADEYKDPSEAFIELGKERFVQWFQEQLQQAERVQDIIKRRNDEELARLHEEVKPILEHQDPLELVKQELQKLYAGDITPALAAYICATTRLLAKGIGTSPAHIMLWGGPSCGKSHALNSVMKLLPESAFVRFDATSPMALVYSSESFKHRVLFLAEADSIPRGEESPAASAIRTLLQEGDVRYDVVVHGDGEPYVHTVTKEGPTVLVTTSTVRLETQLDSRMFTYPMRDDTEQVMAALHAIARAHERGCPTTLNETLVIYQEYLQRLAPIHVTVPFASAFVSCLKGQQAARILRDIQRIFAFVQAVAVIRGRYEATIDDYRAAYDVLTAMYESSAEGVSEQIRTVVRAVYELRTTSGSEEKITLRAVASHIGWHPEQTKRHLQRALRSKWLVNRAERGDIYDLDIGEPLPDEVSLPTPEDVERAWKGNNTPPHNDNNGNKLSMSQGVTPVSQVCHALSHPVTLSGGYSTHTHIADGSDENMCVHTSSKKPVTPVTQRDTRVTPCDTPVTPTSTDDVLADATSIKEEDPFAEDEQAILEWARRRVNYQLITTNDALQEFVSRCDGSISLDVETTALHHTEGRIRVVSISSDDGTVVVDADRVDIKLLQPLFGRCRIIGHNLQFDLMFLMAAGVHVPANVRLVDTMLAAQVLEASNRREEKGFFSLESCLKRYCNIQVDKTLQTADWSGELTEEHLEYAAADTYHLKQLWNELRRRLKENDLLHAAYIEMQALPAVTWMSLNGMAFDADEWKRQAEADEQELQRVLSELDQLVEQETGFLCGANWNSHKQVLELLNKLGIPVDSVSEEALKPYAGHNVVAKYMEYKQLQKLVGAFGAEFLKKARLKDGRIYPNWRQLGASTGRMSCSDPNLQQIPAGKRRDCFKAQEGRVLVVADYSQIELRIAAEIANDARMLEAFKNGVDLHTLTARLVMGKQDVTKADRGAAKAVNFGLLYGMGWRGLKNYAFTTYGVSFTDEQAQQFRDKFFKAYKGLAQWHRNTRGAVEAADVYEARTVSGRRRVLYPKKNKGGVEYPAFTDALNFPVQGTGADGLKMALALLWQEHEQYPSARLVAAVHDELVVECDASEADAVAEWVKSCMIRGMEKFLKRVPVEVEVAVTDGWRK